jgi:Zn-dependent oligopeptidase
VGDAIIWFDVGYKVVFLVCGLVGFLWAVFRHVQSTQNNTEATKAQTQTLSKLSDSIDNLGQHFHEYAEQTDLRFSKHEQQISNHDQQIYQIRRLMNNGNGEGGGNPND